MSKDKQFDENDINLDIENINDDEDSQVEEGFDEFFTGLSDDIESILGSEEDKDEKEQESKEVEEPDEKSDEDEEDDDKSTDKSDEELEELKKYKDFVPLLEAMMNDPGLVDVVKNYLTGGEKPEATDEKFEIPEDFIFDFQEAISDPNSDSAKLLDKYVKMKVKQEVNTELTKEQQSKALEEQKRTVMKKFGASDKDVQELIEWSMRTPLTLEDAYYLKNRSKIEKEIAKNAINSALGKKKNVNKSLSSKGKPGTKTSPEEELFKVIKNTLDFGGGMLG